MLVFIQTMMKFIAVLLLSLLACLAVRATEPSKALNLRLGMKYADAVTQLNELGAKPFECSYRYGHSPEAPKPNFTYAWYTLPSGMSIEIHGDKKQQSDDLLTTMLSVCNSTMLFCCKGESWYDVESIRMLDGNPSLGSPKIWESDEDKSRDITTYICKGMPFTEAEKMLGLAGLKLLPTDDAWLQQMPQGGKWTRYAVKSHNDDCEIIINSGSANPGADTVIRTLLIEAAIPKKNDHKESRYKVECEFLDLKEPLKENWHWAFGESWAWKPKEQGKEDNLKATGQRR